VLPAPLALPTAATTGTRRATTRLLPWLRAAGSVGLLAWVLAHADLVEVFASLAEADLGRVALVLALLPGPMLISGWRWQLLLRAQGHALSLRYLMTSALVALFARQLLPSIIGGDAVRLWDCCRAGVGRGAALAVLLVDRMLGALALVCFALLGLATARDLTAGLPWLPFWLGLGLAAALGAVAAVFLPPRWLVLLSASLGDRVGPRLRSPLQRLVAIGLPFRGAHGVLGRAFGLSLLLQVHVILLYWLMGEALGLGVPIGSYFVIIPVALFAMLLPVSINGIGLREGIFVLLLGLHGVEPARAVAFAWLEYAIYLAWAAVGAAVCAARSPRVVSPG
jgi:glycosyltransferase 2 family protein